MRFFLDRLDRLNRLGRLGTRRGRRSVAAATANDDRHFAHSGRLARPLGRRRRGFGGGSRLRPAPLEELHQFLGFLLSKASQRRPFAMDTGLRTDVDQFLAVKLQLFR